ncbi:MAG: 4'-phosphopantetheinyl transferase superfamily protein [Bacteroidota bacterium]|nr:4'-phosphopantetheinyl transferase superfamily protein [Bacteroidota bacterium]
MEVMHQMILENTKVAVGYHQGYDIGPNKIMSEKERMILSQLSPRKRSEWLASRELLFSIAGLNERVDCLYDEFGKPYLKGSDKHISVSHSASWCAAMISDAPCGVDIQIYSHTVERIVHKFLTEAEFNEKGPLKNRWHQLHLMWGSKECMYKAYGKRKLEFREHIHISDYVEAENRAIGEIRYEDIHLLYDIYYRMLPECAWVYCIERNRMPQRIVDEL